MGNTLIQDSATGNIMGLNPGFIPIGMKEHGGIMYIASVNKEGKGEIGTIPSPIIRDFYKEKNIYNVNKEIPLGETPIQISNKFYPADKFIVNLDMEMNEDNITGTGMTLIKNGENPADWQISRAVWKIQYPTNGDGNIIGIETPIISYNSGNQTENLFSDKGIYKLNLYAKNNSLVKASDNLTSALGNGENHWFYHKSNYTFPKDLMEASLSGIQKQFPSNSKPGYLAVGLELESVGSFSALPRTDEPLMVPYIYKNYSNMYYAYFPGFKYTTDSGLYINTLKNIKVINEQTNHVVPIQAYTQSSEFTDGIDELIIYGRSAPNKKKAPNTFDTFWWPDNFYHFEQYISHQYITNNEFYISPIVWSTANQQKLKSHSHTDFNKPYPRLGLFCADLGDKFNNWYRLELDYYDQFDGYQGHFEQRFNPYLNDVFGTNLTTQSIVCADSLQMGTVYSREVQSVNESVSYTFVYQPNGAPIGKAPLNKKPALTSWDDFPGAFYFSNIGLLSENMVCDNSDVTHNMKVPKSDWTADYRYIYEDNSALFNQIGAITVSQTSIQASLDLPNVLNGDNLGFYVYSRNDVEYWDGNGTSGAKVVSSKFTCSSYDNFYPYNERSVTFQDSFTFTNDNGNVTPAGLPTPTKKTVNTSKNDWLRVTQSPTSITSTNIIKLSAPKETYGFFNLFSDLKDQDITYKGIYILPEPIEQDWQKRYTVTVKPTVEISCTFPSITFDPIYSITPSFLLRGTNENGDSVYVSRFGKADKTTLTYECNFELDKDGIPYNYLDLSSMPEKKTYTSDYHSYIKDLPRYLYEVKDQDSGIIPSLHTGSVVQPGVYVLNMTLCPGHSNQIKSDSSGPIIDLNITMNGKTYSDITTNSYWRMYDDILKFEWDGSEMQFSPLYVNKVDTIDEYTRPYNPLVLIVRQPSVIQLEFIKKLKDYNFEFQQIGLYRVNLNVPLPQLYEQFSRFDSDIYMYQNYMSLIAQYAAQEETPAKKYAYTQIFGAFFREGYVFTEGIYDIDAAECIMYDVKVGDKTYYSIPYIPAEPYILPVKLNIDAKNKVTYSWNTYFMTEIGSNPKFVITNEDGLPTSITNQSKLNALRTTN